MKKLVLLLMPAILFFSCQQTQTIEVVEEVYADGVQKQMIVYEVSGSDSVAIHQTDFHRDGSKKMEGDLINGKRDGEWFSWYPDGTIWSEGSYENGKRTGYSKAYYANGIVHLEGSYKDGKKVGDWKVFNSDGKLETTQEYGKE